MKQKYLQTVSVLAVLILSALMLTGCHNRVFETGYYAPYRILEEDMPYSNNMHDTLFDTVHLLETDSYGRRYYSYTTPSTMTRFNELEIHVISQMETKDGYFYYPDYCYMARGYIGNDNRGIPADPEFSAEAIARLKELNDWDKPLNEERMRSIPRERQRGLVGAAYMEPILLERFNLGDDCYVITHDMEINDRNQQLFFCKVYEPDGRGNTTAKCYVIVCEESETDPIVVIEEIEDSLECQEAMRDFRIKWFEPEWAGIGG